MTEGQEATANQTLEVAAVPMERLSLSEVTPHPDNPRIHSPEQIKAIQESFLLDGPIAGSMGVQKSRKRLYKGHGVYEALLGIGCIEADFVVKDLTDAETLALLARDNALSDMSTNDPVKLKAISVELKEMNIPIQRMGYTLKEITSMQPAKEVIEDEPPEVSEEVVSKTGDLWTLGKHRLLCGDSTIADDVERVMGGEKELALFTDPPYGIDVDTSWLSALNMNRGKPACISDDKLQNDDGTLDLSFLWQYEKRMVWGFPYIFDPEATGWIVWDKQPGVDKRGIVSPIEMASTTLRKGFDMVRCMWGGYYREAGEAKREAHPTQKPLKVFARFIENYTDEADCIYDPFAGSGTVLMVTETLGRKSANIEIAPQYCDVIINRYINHVGSDEHVSVERDDKTLTWEQAERLSKLPKVV